MEKTEETAMAETNESATIVDRGRGPQLSNRRITVQHLLPLFKEDASDAEILRWYELSKAELDLLRQYYRDHTEECLTLEREISAHMEEERKRFPPPPLPTDGMTRDEAKAWMLARIAERKQNAERNGVHDSSG
jgi:uncharacterized protein (DUF433 family)